jgi:hypothetical protein
MKQVFRYDENGFYVEPVILQEGEEIPSDCIEKQPQEGLHKAQLVNGEWVETLSQEEINQLLNAPQPLSELDKLKKDQTDLVFTLMMNGVL